MYICSYTYIHMCVTKVKEIQAITLRVEYIGEGQGRVAGRDWKEEKEGEMMQYYFY